MSDRSPLVSLANDPKVKQARWLSETIQNVDVDTLMEAYRITKDNAPHRHERGKAYFVPHTGLVGGPTNRLEEHLAIALVNGGVPLAFAEHTIVLRDYQVPLKAARADPGVGKVDLVGHDNGDKSLWAIELKYGSATGRGDTPLRALLEVLCYAAILDANYDAIRRDLSSTFGLSMTPPIDLMVAGQSGYWSGWQALGAAGNWMPPLAALTEDLAQRLERRILFVDLGDVIPIVENGRPALGGQLAPKLVL